MVARLLSLFALTALLLMPFAPAPAQAATSSSMAMSGDGHCGGEAPVGADKSLPGAHCGAACALVIPQVGAVMAPTPAREKMPAASPLTPLDGRTPRLATPPPRLG
ncbi:MULTISPECIES: hypothetical protein [Sphingomonas]|uniref:hypothetical protein n=1 Tax=Sphingomonas TaxID=13687 RepID=UPI001269FEB3|nr:MULTISPECIES: hypothetical protein [Sphingomonas]